MYNTYMQVFMHVAIHICDTSMVHMYVLNVCTVCVFCTCVYVGCCMGDFKEKTVHTFVMCAQIPDVGTLRSFDVRQSINQIMIDD